MIVKRIIPDRVHVLIILASFIAQFNLISSLKGLIFLPIPFVIAILINYDYVGGGDIKLITAIGFFLGFRKGLFAIIIGMSIVVFIALPIKNIEKRIYDTYGFIPCHRFVYVPINKNIRNIGIGGNKLKKFLKNRTLVGVVCIIFALILSFGITPMLSKSMSSQTEIIRARENIKKEKNNQRKSYKSKS